MSAAPGERVETETQHRPPVSSPHLLLTPPAHKKSPANPRRAKVPYSDPLSAAERLSSTGIILALKYRPVKHLRRTTPKRETGQGVLPFAASRRRGEDVGAFGDHGQRGGGAVFLETVRHLGFDAGGALDEQATERLGREAVGDDLDFGLAPDLGHLFQLPLVHHE